MSPVPVDSNPERVRSQRRSIPWDRYPRTLLALIAAPIVGGALGLPLTGLILSVFFSQAMGVDAWSVLESLVQSVVLGGVGGAAMGIPTTVFFGWPAHQFLVKIGYKKRLGYVALFAWLGLISPVVFGMILGRFEPEDWLFRINEASPYFLVFAVFGAIGGLVFWSIRRPDIP